MSSLHSIVAALPEHTVTTAEALERLIPHFEEQGEDPSLVRQVFANCGIERRALAMPQPFYLRERSLTARNQAFQVVARELGARAAREAIDQAGLTPDQIDLIIDTSCTGVMIPALDAYLVNALEMRRDVKRMPLTEVGCAAGAVGLSRAREFLQVYPQANVLLLAVELPSLTLQLEDGSRANLVSSAIFGDGAAAAIISNRVPARRSFELLAHRSLLFPNTLDLMGFDLHTEGFRIVLSQRIPALIKKALRPEVDGFLGDQDLRLDQLDVFALHPGGVRVLDNLQQVLELTPAQVEPARDVLRRFGNLSSASVLFVARELLEHRTPRPGQLGLLVAMGPGFAVEMLLLRVV